MATETRNEIFSEMVKAGSRTYFFGVKVTSKGDNYLVITESRKDGETFKRDRILVFDDNLEPFLEGLEKALKVVKGKEDGN